MSYRAIDMANLFIESIQAWDCGSVIPEVYRVFKCYGIGSVWTETDFN